MRYPLFFILLALPILASEVTKVGRTQKHFSISQDAGNLWTLGKPACVIKQGKSLACGEIVYASPSQAILKIEVESTEIGAGDRVVHPGAVPKPRAPAQLMNSLEGEASATGFRFHALTAGVSVGDGFYFPLLHFQRLLDSQFSIGLLPTYLSNSTTSGSVSALGVMGSVNYYSEGFFRGFWGQLAAGPYFFSSELGTTQESASSISVLGTVGWRGNWELGMNVGLGLGVQYLTAPAFTTVQLGLSEIRILVVFDVGLTF